MHCKPPKLKVKQHMASVSGGGGKDDDGDGSRSGKSVTLGHSPRSYASNNNNNNTNNNNNNNNNNDSTSNTSATLDSAQIQLKKQTLEQRKQELEKLLSEKSWLLQQLQKQEAQILNGNYEYLNLNEIFGTLQQCKQDAASSSGSAVLRRKSATAKENHNNNNNNINSTNRHSEISNRSSEYDNYPGEQQVATQQLPSGVSGALKMVHKKRQMPISSNNWHAANTLPQVQQQQQQQHQQLRQHYIAQMTEQQHFQYTQQQVLQHQQQQQQQRHLLQHQHFHPRQQLITAYHSPTLPAQPPDTISLYSANSANVATMRQQQPPHQPQMQTPIVVQCDKYYLSPTHQSYNDGGFIKSSQNIKQYVSPLASPTTSAAATHKSHEQQPVKPLLLHQQQHIVVSSRSFDAISLSPSFAAVMEPQSNSNNIDAAHVNNSNNQRWRSQSNIQYIAAGSSTELKTHSTDMLVNMHPSNASISNFYNAAAVTALKSKPLDEISLASFSSETQKKQKPKQWLESSLDGPAIRTSINNSPVNTPPRPLQAKPLTHNPQRERPRLSSQSMSSGAQRYHNVGQRGKATRLLQDDDGKYVKLSQSTSYLNSIDPLVVNTYFPDAVATPSPLPPREAAYNYLPTKSLASRSTATAAEKPAISPEIRIESPKNMTVVQQATFQPYKEITKPFEMSDFYKYSTKFKQKEPTAATTLHKAETQEKS